MSCCCRKPPEWEKNPIYYCAIGLDTTDGSLIWKHAWPYLDVAPPSWIHFAHASGILAEGAFWVFGWVTDPDPSAPFPYEWVKKLDPATGLTLAEWTAVDYGTNFDFGAWLNRDGVIYQLRDWVGEPGGFYAYSNTLGSATRWDFTVEPPAVVWSVPDMSDGYSPTGTSSYAFLSGDELSITISSGSPPDHEVIYRVWSAGTLTYELNALDLVHTSDYSAAVSERWDASGMSFDGTPYSAAIVDVAGSYYAITPFGFAFGGISAQRNDIPEEHPSYPVVQHIDGIFTIGGDGQPSDFDALWIDWEFAGGVDGSGWRRIIPFDFDAGGVYGYYHLPIQSAYVITDATSPYFLYKERTRIVYVTGPGSVSTVAEICDAILPTKILPDAGLLICRQQSPTDWGNQFSLGRMIEYAGPAAYTNQWVQTGTVGYSVAATDVVYVVAADLSGGFGHARAWKQGGGSWQTKGLRLGLEPPSLSGTTLLYAGGKTIDGGFGQSTGTIGGWQAQSLGECDYYYGGGGGSPVDGVTDTFSGPEADDLDGRTTDDGEMWETVGGWSGVNVDSTNGMLFVADPAAFTWTADRDALIVNPIPNVCQLRLGIYQIQSAGNTNVRWGLILRGNDDLSEHFRVVYDSYPATGSYAKLSVFKDGSLVDSLQSVDVGLRGGGTSGGATIDGAAHDVGVLEVRDDGQRIGIYLNGTNRPLLVIEDADYATNQRIGMTLFKGSIGYPIKVDAFTARTTTGCSGLSTYTWTDVSGTLRWVEDAGGDCSCASRPPIQNGVDEGDVADGLCGRFLA